MSEVDVRVGRLPDPYRLDVAYADGRLIGTVERFVMDEPDPDRLGPYIRRALREGFAVKLLEPDPERPEEAGC